MKEEEERLKVLESFKESRNGLYTLDMRLFTISFVTRSYGRGVAVVAAHDADEAYTVLVSYGHFNGAPEEYDNVTNIQDSGCSNCDLPTLLEEELTAVKIVSGPKGDKGDKGDSGTQGSKGDKGDRGDKGESGAAGKSAYEIALNNGYSGTEEQWVQSLKGEKGDSGEKGDAGSSGKDGRSILSITKTGNTDNIDTYTVKYSDNTEDYISVTNGEKGERGDSAYQSAVDAGYKGTEIEWVSALANVVNTGKEIKTIDNKIDKQGETIASIRDRVSNNERSISTLNSDSNTEGSVKKTVADAIALIVAGAPADFDTLKEIADYIASDKTGAAQMSAALSQLQSLTKTHTDEIATNTADIATNKDDIADNASNIEVLQKFVDNNQMLVEYDEDSGEVYIGVGSWNTTFDSGEIDEETGEVVLNVAS